MLSALLKLYPYTPSITPSGIIDPKSIHSKTTEKVLALLTTALASIPLVKKSPTSWAILGVGAIGYISYLFWSKLGAWVPNKIADQICVQHFLQAATTPAGIAYRVLNNAILHDEIFNKILSVTNISSRDTLLKNYLIGIWNRLPVTPVTQALSCYIKTVIIMTNQDMQSFNPSSSSQMRIWTSTSHALDTNTINLLKKNFNIDIIDNDKTPFATLAANAVHSQDEEATWQPILARMTLLLNAECNAKLLLNKEFDLIYDKSSLGLYIQNIQPNDKNFKVASCLQEYLSTERALVKTEDIPEMNHRI